MDLLNKYRILTLKKSLVCLTGNFRPLAALYSVLVSIPRRWGHGSLQSFSPQLKITVGVDRPTAHDARAVWAWQNVSFSRYEIGLCFPETFSGSRERTAAVSQAFSFSLFLSILFSFHFFFLGAWWWPYVLVSRSSSSQRGLVGDFLSFMISHQLTHLGRDEERVNVRRNTIHHVS